MTTPPEKICRICGIQKPTNQFYTSRNYTSYKCKKCRNAQAKVWADKNREKCRSNNKLWQKAHAARYAFCRLRSFIKRTYGMTLDQRDAMLVEQEGCAICHKAISFKGGNGAHVDHSRVLKGLCSVRGILCQKCNMGLGQFNDNTQIIREAADYLEVFEYARS